MLWSTIAAAHSRNFEQKDHVLRPLCLAIARFTRNLVAAIPSNQTEALSVLIFLPTPFPSVADDYSIGTQVRASPRYAPWFTSTPPIPSCRKNPVNFHEITLSFPPLSPLPLHFHTHSSPNYKDARSSALEHSYN